MFLQSYLAALSRTASERPTWRRVPRRLEPGAGR